MQLNITGHNVEITPAMRDFVTAKFSKLEQFFDRINQVYIVLKVEKVTQIADANLHVNGGEIHASAEGQDMYAAVDGLIDKHDAPRRFDTGRFGDCSGLADEHNFPVYEGAGDTRFCPNGQGAAYGLYKN